MCCWLCKFNHTEEAKMFHSFFIDHLGSMTMEEMAAEIAEKIPDTSEQILLHFDQHTLHPSVKITHMLRNLFDISKDLKSSIISVDENKHTTVDVKTLESYLKVQSQIMSIYRTGDLKKLLFA